MLRNGQEISFTNHAGQPWTASWHPPAPPPPGKPHGSAAICRSQDGRIVLVSADQGETCYFPGGRPEGNEDWLETLEREVYEEACARVLDATLLGFSWGTCLEGPEEGLILVRGLWVADVSLEPWEPDHEMTDRILVPADEVLGRIQIDQGMGPLVHRWVSEALGPAAIPQD